MVSADVGQSAALEDLEAALGHEFATPALLHNALVHRSHRSQRPDLESNERLEFLGDSVLGLVVTTDLYRRYPEAPEGELARIRAAVVNEATLTEIAREVGLGRYLLLDKGEDASGGRDKPSLLADAMEAVIAAVYLDGGWKPAEVLVCRLLHDRIAEASRSPALQESKNRLQERAAGRFADRPRYIVSSEGPEHEKCFHAEVLLGGQVCGRGDGSSSTRAEQAAASDALDRLADSEISDSPPFATEEGHNA